MSKVLVIGLDGADPEFVFGQLDSNGKGSSNLGYPQHGGSTSRASKCSSYLPPISC